MEEQTFSTQRLDHLGIVAGICNQIGLIEQVDNHIGEQHRDVSVGQAVQAMVLNGLGFVSRPLYLTPEFFHTKPVDMLIGDGVTAEKLNDDCLGRALDRLFEQGVTEVFAKVSAHALGVFGIQVRQAHLDSTSISFQGEYAVERPTSEGVNEDDPIAISITHGYSRDRRPDLKQAVLSLISANQSSIPVWINALSGNQADSSSFPKTIQAYLDEFSEEEETPIIVADAALYSQGNLQAISENVIWISRVPGSVNEVKTLYQAVAQEQMTVYDKHTWIYETSSDYAGVQQRWVLVWHKQTRQRELATVERTLKKEKTEAEKALRRLGRREFVSQEAAQSAVETLETTWKYHQVWAEYLSIPHYDQVGRPEMDAEPDQLLWQVNATIIPKPDRVAQARARCGKYVVATNETAADQLSAAQILNTYKEQNVSVERGFRFLKDPMFFAHALFLKKPARIMALLMVMALSLLVYALGEHILRAQLAQRDETVPDQRGKPTNRPTLRRIFQIFEGIDVLYAAQSERRRRSILNLRDIHYQILALFSSHVREFYFLRE